MMGITLSLLSLAGAVALLLWGVHMVESGVQRVFGPHLRGFLARALKRRVSAFAAGLGITALLQSSTATALMVTRFSSAGLVDLSAALAVMLGANVGTTLIVQVLSFDVGAVAPVLILVGVLLFRRMEGPRHDFGRVLIGLGLILTALGQFVTLLHPLTADPSAREVMARLSAHIVFFVLVGALLTWAAHSSVAIVLVAASLAAQGAAPIGTAIGIVLGANLGTAINPVFEGGADARSRRVALGNLLTRLLGVVIALAAFPWIQRGLSHLQPGAAHAVADFHTLFNLVLALLFLPWLDGYAGLLTRWLPDDQTQHDPGATLYLDPETRETPTVALGGASREALRMTDALERMLAALRGLFLSGDRRRIAEIRGLDKVLDRLNTAIKEYVVSIDPELMSEPDRERSALILAFITNLTQAGDLIDRNLIRIVTRRQKRGLSFSDAAQDDLLALVDRLRANVRAAASLFVSGDKDAVKLLLAERDAFRAVEADAVAAHFERLRSSETETIETSSLHLDALCDLKRINAHLIEAVAAPLFEAEPA
jgi:phosphate:Na+ symporter